MDTWMGNNHDPITLHKYLYANADPGNMVDPSGNFSIGSMMSAVNTMATLVSTAQTAITAFNIATGEEEFSAKEAGIAILWSMVGSRGGALFKPLQKLLRRSGCLTNSFAEGTLVTTNSGLANIEDVQIGDLVLSFNEETGINEYKPVIHIITSDETKDVVEIQLSTGKSIETTPEHLFYIDGQWKKAENILEGQKLYSLDAQVSVDAIKRFQVKLKVYNLTVKDNHNYFVGAERVLVHNISPCEKTAKAIAQSLPKSCKQPFKCDNFAIAFEKRLINKNVNGRRLCVQTNPRFFVGSVRHGQISRNNNHFAVQVGDLVFDNVNPDGIPFAEWADDIGITDDPFVNMTSEDMTGRRNGCIN